VTLGVGIGETADETNDTGFGLTEYWRDELGCEVKIVVAMPELNGVVC
jgi:hypothetical protein